MNYQVTNSVVGLVYTGPSMFDAMRHFSHYRLMSQLKRGRLADSEVRITDHKGDTIKHYQKEGRKWYIVSVSNLSGIVEPCVREDGEIYYYESEEAAQNQIKIWTDTVFPKHIKWEVRCKDVQD